MSHLGMRWKVIIAIALTAAVLAAGGYFYIHRTPKLTDKDTIVLADFSNSTGDAIFDGTLRQGLSVQLEQPPFLRIVPEDQIKQTLRQMGQPPDARLTPELARGLCQRTGSAATLNGSIASLGTQYVLGLQAVNCRTGDSLAQQQVTADGKEQVLKVLGEAAPKLRKELGESLSTVQKLDVPLEQATTSSLEALQTYSLGRRTMEDHANYSEAVPIFERAISLDPNFAMAYASLATCHYTMGEAIAMKENAKKAFELRERVSEREKYYIESHYYQFAVGDLEKARQVYELSARAYPRDDGPLANLGEIYSRLGQHDKALMNAREALRLNPVVTINKGMLAEVYISLNRFEEAQSILVEALATEPDSYGLRFEIYWLAFMRNEPEVMARQVAWGRGKPLVEAEFLMREFSTAAYSGRFVMAREFAQKAGALAEHAADPETLAGYETNAAYLEALSRNTAEARQQASRALKHSNSKNVMVFYDRGVYGTFHDFSFLAGGLP